MLQESTSPCNSVSTMRQWVGAVEDPNCSGSDKHQGSETGFQFGSARLVSGVLGRALGPKFHLPKQGFLESRNCGVPLRGSL